MASLREPESQTNLCQGGVLLPRGRKFKEDLFQRKFPGPGSGQYTLIPQIQKGVQRVLTWRPRSCSKRDAQLGTATSGSTARWLRSARRGTDAQTCENRVRAPGLTAHSIFPSTTMHISKGISPPAAEHHVPGFHPALESQAQHAHLESKRDFPGVRVGMMWAGLFKMTSTEPDPF